MRHLRSFRRESTAAARPAVARVLLMTCVRVNWAEEAGIGLVSDVSGLLSESLAGFERTRTSCRPKGSTQSRTRAVMRCWISAISSLDGFGTRQESADGARGCCPLLPSLTCGSGNEHDVRRTCWHRDDLSEHYGSLSGDLT